MKVRIIEKTIFMVHHDGMTGPHGLGTVEAFEDITHEPTMSGVFMVFETPSGKRSIHQDRVRSITTKYEYKDYE